MSRADVHAAIRAKGGSADLDALIALLEGHKATLNRVLELEAASQRADNVTRHNLNMLGNRARKFLRRIDRSLDRPLLGSAHDDLGYWGRNGCAPTIDDTLRSAEFHASYAVGRKAAA